MTTTITLQDATASDLTQALAHPVTTPPPTTNPPPSGSPPPGNLVTLINGSDGPNGFISYDVNTKATWLTLRSYLKGSVGGTFAGNFIDFQCMNNAGTWGSGVGLNGGYIAAVPGSENGDLDIVFPVDGVQANVSFTGRYQGNPAGIMPWPSQLLQIGALANKFSELWLQEFPPRPGMPPGTVACVKINGKYCPLFN